MKKRIIGATLITVVCALLISNLVGVLLFRGREMAHPEQGLNVLERLAEDLKPYATVESKPKMEGRNMLMLLAPIKGAFDEDKAASDTK